MGSYLDSPNTEKLSTPVFLNKRLRYVATAMQGWRATMEDSHIDYVDEKNDTYIFGVFDGHGGKEVAAFVNKHFIQELLSSNAFLEKDYPLALTETFLKMDDLLQDPQNKPELKSLGDFNDDKGNEPNNEENNSGCTANVILLVGNHLYTANVGDSRSVIYEDGNFIELSFDHKPHKEEEKNRILKSGGSVIKGRINGDISVSRAIGDFEYKKNSNIGREEQLMIATPEITQRILNEKSEFILMGCDGIWETKKTEKIMKIVAENLKTKKISLRIIAENLLDRLIAKDGEEAFGLDNMTCILIEFRKRSNENEETKDIDQIEYIEKLELEKMKAKKTENNENNKTLEEKRKKENDEKDKEFRKKLDQSVLRQIEERKKKLHQIKSQKN